MVVGWADTPGLSTCVGYCSAAWLQSWLQPRVHGSGVRLSDLSNLCPLPARTRSPIFPTALTIPCIFRIMNTSAVTSRTLQGMARARSGQAPAWPLVSDRSVRCGLQGQARLRVYVGRCLSSCAGCPAGSVALGAGGADTYAQRAIPGSDLFLVRSPSPGGLRAPSQVVVPAVLSGSCRSTTQSTTSSARGGHGLLIRSSVCTGYCCCCHSRCQSQLTSDSWRLASGW